MVMQIAVQTPDSIEPRIHPAALRRALIAGVRRVLAQRETIDRINVFPVPDGDTGSNLAFTLNAVLCGALSKPARDSGELLRQVADDAIDGARGNSGAIMAQFLQGVSEIAVRGAALTPARLAQAVRHGAQQARAAMAEPREGTILSVIRAFADALDEQAARGADGLRAWYSHALQRARVALAATPQQLAALRQAGVVDAGALGFVEMAEGIGGFLERGRSEAAGHLGIEDGLHAADFADVHLMEDCDPAQRFCTECLLAGDGIDRAGVRAALVALGAGSVVVAGSAQRVRVHAHVGQPQALFEAVARFGRVSGHKAEDMLAQQRDAASGARVAVVTDSAADLPEPLMAAAGIQMVPVRVSFGSEDFLDKVSLSTAQFFQRLRTDPELPKTSQPPPGDFRRRFESALSHHEAVVYVGLSRAVSGTLQAGESAAARCDAARVRVFDTGHASCGQALLALAAADAARAGGDLDAVMAALAAARDRTRTEVMVRDIAHAVRGGRVPRWILPIARLLGLSPMGRMTADGRIKVVSALFGGARREARFARRIVAGLPAGRRWRVLVGHCDAPDSGQALLDALRARLDCADGWLTEAGPGIGAHAGPGALVVGLQSLPD